MQTKFSADLKASKVAGAVKLNFVYSFRGLLSVLAIPIMNYLHGFTNIILFCVTDATTFHMKKCQCIYTTIMNLQINGYFPHTTKLKLISKKPGV